MDKLTINQGDIYFVKMEGIGSEQQGYRPFLVASTNHINKKSGIVVGYPITHARKRNMPYHYILTKDQYNFLLYDRNIVLTECVSHLSIDRLEKYMGKINGFDLHEIWKCSQYVFIEKTF